MQPKLVLLYALDKPMP